MSHEDNEQHADNVPINRTVISMPKKQEVSTQWAYCVSFSLPLKLKQWSRPSLKYRQESSITACLLVQIEKLVGLFVCLIWFTFILSAWDIFPPCLGWKKRQKQRDINEPTQKIFSHPSSKMGVGLMQSHTQKLQSMRDRKSVLCSEWFVRVMCLTTKKTAFLL